MRSIAFAWTAMLALLAAGAAHAQTFPDDDPVLEEIWTEGTEGSRVEALAQALLDSIGPRLVGSPGHAAAVDWIVETYEGWGIDAREEAYGTWLGWRRGITHVDLVAPRVRSLEGTMLAWSVGTDDPVEGPVVAFPDVASRAGFEAWLPSVEGAFVLVSRPEPTCRPRESWEEWAGEDGAAAIEAARKAAEEAWRERLARAGLEDPRALPRRIAAAGARGVVSAGWSGGWGTGKVFGARTDRAPSIHLACEDYGLVWRLVEHNQGPRLRLEAEAEDLGEVPVHNAIGEIRGTERPDEFVVLSAHLDSWDAASGATDNGTGTVVMMEAMRILRAVLPDPRRTILAGHWGGEEQGLNGSRAFAEDHPEVVEGIQALFNQDNGTGPVQEISMQGLVEAGEAFAGWFASIPEEITGHVELRIPGTPGGGGTDSASFVCHGATAFTLFSEPWDYWTYTWHTNRDTYDKLAFDAVRENAILVAMLAYLASEDPERVPWTRREVLPPARDGSPGSWPACRAAERDSERGVR